MPVRRSRRATAPAMVAEAPGAPSVLFDTNILLDVVLLREPWADPAARLLDRAARGAVSGFVSAHALTTLHYIVQHAAGRRAAVTAVQDVLSVLEVVPLAGDDFQRALALRLADFEDAVQAAACLRVGATYLVTRNAGDFRGAPVVTRSAVEVLALLGRWPGGEAER